MIRLQIPWLRNLCGVRQKVRIKALLSDATPGRGADGKDIWVAGKVCVGTVNLMEVRGWPDARVDVAARKVELSEI